MKLPLEIDVPTSRFGQATDADGEIVARLIDGCWLLEGLHRFEELFKHANMLDKIRDLVFFSSATASDVLDEIEAILKGQEK
jgi:hypothetical protein